ncbi:prion-inhibition and propagation-domain-containing protein [Dendryphion nanum]|uniref:Prion-inhibition and propagation-domain-containing protein n=1 Tax=Dendryphion nanum TaxID=256645 RepID=A0A9P9E9A8_9PLEO|nr:prion-inhibition and propagation-domain-containing protein [Dendryphion nanum]
MASATASATANGAPATPPTTPPPSTDSKPPPPTLTKAQILTNVLSLASQFSVCVEAFNLVHPAKDSDREQKVALAKLGIQQGRLLIFGDAVGISSPPATIAKHMIPSHPGATNPDPHLPVNFGVRDPQLDDPAKNEQVRKALDEIAGRPSHLSRDELMAKYGLKSPKRFTMLEYPALDTNRLEAFREKYALLQDLARQSGTRVATKRGMSMTMQHWTVHNVDKFDAFVDTARTEIDNLITLMGVKEQVDRGMKTDIRAMGWHPDLSGPLVRQDWEKLRLIREACIVDYPEYVDATYTALKYISEELKGSSLSHMRAQLDEQAQRRKSDDSNNASTRKEKDKRPSWLSHFKLKSWTKSKDGTTSPLSADRPRSKSIADPAADDESTPRSMSDSLSPRPAPTSEPEDGGDLAPVRSKSLSALPDEPAPFNLDSRLHHVSTASSSGDTQAESGGMGEVVENDLAQATTVNSLVDRHDMYKGVGRIETRDIREKTREANS